MSLSSVRLVAMLLVAVAGCSGAPSDPAPKGKGRADVEPPTAGPSRGGPDLPEQPPPGSQPDAGGAYEDVAVLTWNMEHFPLSSATVEDVRGILTTLQPDVVGLQEVEDLGAFSALGDSLPGYESLYAYDPGAYTRVALLYKTSRVQVSDVETLFPQAWYPFPRPPLKAHVTVAGAGGEVLFDFEFLVLHLKAYGDAESESRRRQACTELDAWIRERRAAGTEQDFVVAGDWNDKLDDPAADNVFAPFLDAPDTYRFLTQPLAEKGAFSYIPYKSLIDHVLVTADALDEYGEGSTEALPLEATVANYQSAVSDHRPVLARFHVPVP